MHWLPIGQTAPSVCRSRRQDGWSIASSDARRRDPDAVVGRRPWNDAVGGVLVTRQTQTAVGTLQRNVVVVAVVVAGCSSTLDVVGVVTSQHR